MRLRGEWISANDIVRAGDLHAWGEWEPESDLIRKLNRRPGETRHPRFLWHPYYVPKTSYRELHNTDPFVFGKRFLYSNCGQPSKPGLRHLAEGSVIAFGSGTEIGGERRWMLDTVLVVRDFIDYDPRGACVMLEDCTPAAFLVATGGPLTDNDYASAPGTCAPRRTRLRLYRGATPYDPVDGMFSFFPATPAGGDSGFPRPLVDLPGDYFNPRSWQAPKGVGRSRTRSELRGLWDSLTAQVRDANLVLGTRAELPEQREA